MLYSRFCEQWILKCLSKCIVFVLEHPLVLHLGDEQFCIYPLSRCTQVMGQSLMTMLWGAVHSQGTAVQSHPLLQYASNSGHAKHSMIHR